MARNNAATLAGLAALAGAAYMYNKKKDEGTDLGSIRAARPADTKTSGLDESELQRETKRGPTGSIPTKTKAPAPVEASDTETSDTSVTPSSRVTPGGAAKRTEGNQPMPSLRAVEARAASNKTDAMRNASRAQQAATNRMRAMAANPEAQAAEPVYPEQYMTPGGGFKTAVGMAKNLASRGGQKLAEYSTPLLRGAATEVEQVAPRLGAPTKQLTGPSKADLLARDRAARATTRQEQMMNENAANYGLNPEAPGYGAAAGALRDKLGGADFSLGMKKGGKVKKMASGGMTSKAPSASRRGDGIASRGKTRCKIC
jgi:hypothetical protein